MKFEIACVRCLRRKRKRIFFWFNVSQSKQKIKSPWISCSDSSSNWNVKHTHRIRIPLFAHERTKRKKWKLKNIKMRKEENEKNIRNRMMTVCCAAIYWENVCVCHSDYDASDSQRSTNKQNVSVLWKSCARNSKSDSCCVLHGQAIYLFNDCDAK